MRTKQGLNIPRGIVKFLKVFYTENSLLLREAIYGENTRTELSGAARSAAQPPFGSPAESISKVQKRMAHPV